MFGGNFIAPIPTSVALEDYLKKKKHLKAFCFSATRCLGSGARANLAAALIMKFGRSIDIQISRDQVPLRPQAAVWILRYEVLLAGVS